jgi:hypothetical protein
MLHLRVLVFALSLWGLPVCFAEVSPSTIYHSCVMVKERRPAGSTIVRLLYSTQSQLCYFVVVSGCQLRAMDVTNIDFGHLIGGEGSLPV